MSQDQITETLILLKKIWVLFLFVLLAMGMLTENYFPGERETPEKGEEILWNLQQLFFFGLMSIGFLIDIVQMRGDRNKAFIFLFLSLMLGGLAGMAGAMQYRLLALVLGLGPIE